MRSVCRFSGFVQTPIAEPILAAGLQAALKMMRRFGLDRNSHGAFESRLRQRGVRLGGRLVAIGRGAGEVEALVGELIGMRAKGRRVSGKSDDLVLALSLAWWWVRKVEWGWKSGRIV
jgi:hypothetical protein